MSHLTLLPDLAYVDGALRRNCAINVDERGFIASVGSLEPGSTVERLLGRALLPGFVNAHSHAFQRALRGRTEWRAQGRDDFWSWRGQMYQLAGTLDPEQLGTIARQVFLEMLLCGITAVGEFHYLHRDPQGQPYADPHEMALQLVRAAETVGLRIALLRVAYVRGGRERPLEGAQRRFGAGPLDQFLAESKGLAQRLAKFPMASFGLAPHSVRAVPKEWLISLGELARGEGWPLHMHLAEQPAEDESCQAEHGLRPVELVAAAGLLDARFTAVHAIELSPAEISALGRAAATVCACPTTERNLGDGVVPARDLRCAGTHLALGSDSQIQIDPLEDARELECHLRLLSGERVLFPPEERGSSLERGHSALAAALLGAAPVGGARAVGVHPGALKAGVPADLCSIDLKDPSLAGQQRRRSPPGSRLWYQRPLGPGCLRPGTSARGERSTSPSGGGRGRLCPAPGEVMAEPLELVSTLRRLVSIDTVSSRSNLPCIDQLESWLTDRGGRCERVPYEVSGVPKANLIARFGPEAQSSRAEGLALVGHTDTVPYDPASGPKPSNW